MRDIPVFAYLRHYCIWSNATEIVRTIQMKDVSKSQLKSRFAGEPRPIPKFCKGTEKLCKIRSLSVSSGRVRRAGSFALGVKDAGEGEELFASDVERLHVANLTREAIAAH